MFRVTRAGRPAATHARRRFHGPHDETESVVSSHVLGFRNQLSESAASGGRVMSSTRRVTFGRSRPPEVAHPGPTRRAVLAGALGLAATVALPRDPALAAPPGMT